MSDPYPTLDTVSELYNDNCIDDANFDPVNGGFIDKLKDFFGLRLIRRLSGDPRSILDYGTGNGRFAILARKAFPEAKVHAADYAPLPPKAISHLDIKYINLMDLTDRYDLIILRHVLEHNHDPVGLLKILSERLTDAGIIYIEVPNFDGWYCGQLSRWVNSVSIPFHIFHFTKKSLSRVVRDSGMKGEVYFADMPLMGTSIALLAGRSKTPLFQWLGVIGHPVQILLSALMGPACLAVLARKS